MDSGESFDFGGFADGDFGVSRPQQLPNESLEDYLSRLKSLGLAAEMTGLKEIKGPDYSAITGRDSGSPYSRITPGTTSGLGALGGGTTAGAGAGGIQMDAGRDSGSGGGTRNYLSGSFTTQPEAPHGGPPKAASYSGGPVSAPRAGVWDPTGTMKLFDAIGTGKPDGYMPPRRGRNSLSDLMDEIQYVRPAYRNQQNPYAVDPSTYLNGVAARNYLDQLMRSRGGR